ncbi:MAG: hypothetical protein WC184_10475 [Acidimicrobiia bacterium]
MNRLKTVLAVVAAFAVLTVSACSSDDKPSGGSAKAPSVSAEEKPYVDAMVSGFDRSEDELNLTDAQVECISAGMVKTVGVNRFKDHGVTPEDLSDRNDSFDLSELELSMDDGYKIYDSFGSCGVNFREVLLEELGADEDMSSEAKDCVAKVFDEKSTRTFAAALFTGGEDVMFENPEVAEIFSGLMECMFMDMDFDMDDE